MVGTTSVKKGWSPPGRFLGKKIVDGTGMSRLWVIPPAQWRRIWDAYHGSTDRKASAELIGDILWETVRCPPSLGMRLIDRLANQTHEDDPVEAKPTRRETELSGMARRVSMPRAIWVAGNIGPEYPPAAHHSRSPNLNEILHAAIRMQGYSTHQILNMTPTFQLAKILEFHVYAEPIIVSMRPASYHRRDELP